MNLDTCKEGQRLTITTFDRPLMVAAGAGSGKTFTLTRRIAYGLLAGEEAPGGLQSIDEVLAITFTVKAAAELRDRIRALLRRCFSRSFFAWMSRMPVTRMPRITRTTSTIRMIFRVPQGMDFLGSSWFSFTSREESASDAAAVWIRGRISCCLPTQTS